MVTTTSNTVGAPGTREKKDSSKAAMKLLPQLNNVPDDYDYTLSTHYNRRWSADDRMMDVSEASRAARAEEFYKIADDYYSLTTPIYESGWGKSFHYCHFQPGFTIKQSIQAYERLIADKIGLRRGMKVLDVGCGIGEPARNIARYIGCEIVGVTINAWQIERGEELNEEEGLDGQVKFVQCNFMDMPFEDHTFDAAFAIEATCHAADQAALYAEVARVLKPGATFGETCWVMTDKFDRKQPEHLGLLHRLERGNGVARMPTAKEVRSAYIENKFDIQFDQDLASWSKPGPWYYAPQGDLTYCVDWEDWWKVFKMHPTVRFLWYWFFYLLCMVGLLEWEVMSVMKTMRYCCGSVVEGGQKDLFTPIWLFVCQKTDETEQVIKERKKLKSKDSRKEGKKGQ
ncbi:hypothetical protein MBLNU230_g7683t1 [Neophaeotheca triangularis]